MERGAEQQKMSKKNTPVATGAQVNPNREIISHPPTTTQPPSVLGGQPRNGNAASERDARIQIRTLHMRIEQFLGCESLRIEGASDGAFRLWLGLHGAYVSLWRTGAYREWIAHYMAYLDAISEYPCPNPRPIREDLLAPYVEAI